MRLIPNSITNSTVLHGIYKYPAKVCRIVYKPLDLVADKITRTLFSALKINPHDNGASVGPGGTLEMDGGFVAFLTSSYCLTLVFMMILVNRIHNLVPPLRPTALRISTVLRITIRLPSLLLLLRGIVLMTALLGKENGYSMLNSTFASYFASTVAWLTIFAGRSSLFTLVADGSFEQVQVAQVLGEVFISVCSSIITESFIRALDDDLRRQGNFNALSFAFLIHIQSSPSHKRSLFPTPVYIHFLLILLEIFTLHISYCFPPPYPSFKLYITGFYSLVGQAFVIRAALLTWTARQSLLVTMGSGSNWESSVFLSRAPEVMFESVILLTVVLRFLAALLRREPLTKESILGHSSHYPSRSEDWALGVIKYGSSCLEHTRLAGLSNEVDPITFNLFSSKKNTSAKPLQISYVELARGTKSGLISRREAAGDEKERAPRRKGKGIVGFENEVIAVDVEGREPAVDPMARDPNRSKELIKVVKILYRIIYFLLYSVYRYIAFQFRRLLRTAGLGGDASTLEDTWKVSPPSNENDEDDEEDEDYSPTSSVYNSRAGSPSFESDSDAVEEGSEGEEEEEFDPTVLYRDLSSPASRRHQRPNYNQQQSSSLAASSFIPYEDEPEDDPQPADNYTPILLAHILTKNDSPLTRRRYNLLANPNSNSLPSSSSSDAFSSALINRRQEVLQRQEALQAGEEGEEDTRNRNCVVCNMEERTIILWPCRCLSLCEDCREEISKRSNASSHLCPTCRTTVKGFSRIFIP